MKYNIDINQLALMEISPNLDIFDAAILDYIIVMCRSANDKIEKKRIIDKNGDAWTWIDFSQLLKDLPILHFKSKGSVTPRIKKIEKVGYISTLSKRSKGHINLFIKMNGLADSLFIYVNRPIQLDEQGSQKPIHVAEPIIILNTIHNNTKTLELFDKFWEEYPNKTGKKPVREIWQKKIKPDIAEIIIEDVKKRKASDRRWIDGFIPNPSTYLNQERWNDEISPPKKSSISATGPTVERGKYDHVSKK